MKSLKVNSIIRRPGAGRRQVKAPDLPAILGDDTISLARRVYESLSEGLMAGAVEPGSSLTSRSLSVALGVSATPVREALKQLESDGALTSRNKSAFFVNDPDLTEFRQITELRLSTEGLAARKAAETATPMDIAALRKLQSEYEAILRSTDRAPSLLPNFRFHFAIYALSASPILIKVIRSTWLRIGPMLHRHIKTDHAIDSSVHIHEQIVSALERNDPVAAEAALRKDLTDAAELIYPQLRTRLIQID